MEIQQEMVEEVIRRILRVSHPERIILFGSAAQGAMTKDSDVDILVLEPSPGNTRERGVIIGDALRGLGFPIDVVVMATGRFDESKNVIGGIAFPANKYGKVIYEAA